MGLGGIPVRECSYLLVHTEQVAGKLSRALDSYGRQGLGLHGNGFHTHSTVQALSPGRCHMHVHCSLRAAPITLAKEKDTLRTQICTRTAGQIAQRHQLVGDSHGRKILIEPTF